MKNFERNELHAISRRARDWAHEVKNPNWIRAYKDLAHAANVLDDVRSEQERAVLLVVEVGADYIELAFAQLLHKETQPVIHFLLADRRRVVSGDSHTVHDYSATRFLRGRNTITKEIPEIDQKQVLVYFSKRINEAGPPGQTALIGGVSATGVKLCPRVGGENHHQLLVVFALHNTREAQQQ